MIAALWSNAHARSVREPPPRTPWRRRAAARGRPCGAASTTTPRSRAGRRGYAVSARRQAGAHAGAPRSCGADAGAGAGDRRGMGGAARSHRSGKNAADAAGQCDHRRRRRPPRPVAAEIEKYLASDLLFYRASESAGLASSARRCIGTRSWLGRATHSAPHFKLGRGRHSRRSARGRACGRRSRDPERSVAARRACMS